MRRVAAVAVMLCALSFAPAHAASTDIVAGPFGVETGYFTTPAALVQRGDTAVFRNIDLSVHSLESEAFGSDARAWCGLIDPTRPESATNPRAYPLGRCPLFWAERIGSRATYPVQGLDAVEPGRSYAFRCGLAQNMRGLLVVADTEP